MSIAFDAVIGDLPEYPLPLFNYTFSSTSTYTNPFDSSQVWGVPDEIRVITDTKAQLTVQSSTFHDVSSYSDDLSASASLSTSFGWFGASVSAKYARSVCSNTDTYGAFSSSALKVNLYDMVAVKTTLSSDALAFVNNLPEQFDVSAYLPFIHRYGTHFIEKGNFGGRGEMSSAINKQFVSSSSDTQVSATASVHFAFVKAGGSSQSTVKDADSSFTSNSNFQTVLEGGDVTLGLLDWNQWIKTFFDAPALVGYTLRDVASLLPDGPQKQNVQTMTSQYLEGSVTEVVTIAGSPKSFDWMNGDFTRHATPVNGYPAFCRDVGQTAPFWVYFYNGKWTFGAGDQCPGCKGTCASAVPPSAPGWSCSDSNYAYVVAHSFTPCGLEWLNNNDGGAPLTMSCSIN